MKTVWKFAIPLSDDVTVAMPKGASILSLQPQRNQVCIWALVDSAQPTEMRTFRIAGTGYPIEGAEQLRFIATFQVADGSLVFHVFEYIEAKIEAPARDEFPNGIDV